MTSATAVISLLHQPERGTSADRLFRGEPVLSWTLRRVAHARHVDSIVVVAWDDQLTSIRQALPSPGTPGEGRVRVLHRGPNTSGITVHSNGARKTHPKLESLSASLRWSDGWRGGLLGATPLDNGFDPTAIKQSLKLGDGDLALLIDPDSALVDPTLLDALVAHAESKPHIDHCFMPAAPGLSGLLLRPALLDRLEKNGHHPGRLLNYYPDLPGKDPLGKDECAPVPTAIARTLHRIDLSSQRQLHRIELAAQDLNGQLSRVDAEDLVHRMNRLEALDPFPREIELELTTARATSPIFSPRRHLALTRPDLTLDLALRLFDQLKDADDLRLTLTGLGDPLLHPKLPEIIAAAKNANIRAIHVETDLLPSDPTMLPRLIDSGIDLISIHLPATSVATYTNVMGTDALPRVLENLQLALTLRQSLYRGVPLLIPTFVKCPANLHEMEAWYDHWLMTLGSAVITGPTDFCNLIPRCEVADMTPPKRRPCRRLSSRMTILSDGTVVPCSQDITAKHPLGHLSTDSLRDLWSSRLSPLRSTHSTADWDAHPLCAPCREWHRP